MVFGEKVKHGFGYRFGLFREQGMARILNFDDLERHWAVMENFAHERFKTLKAIGFEIRVESWGVPFIDELDGIIIPRFIFPLQA